MTTSPLLRGRTYKILSVEDPAHKHLAGREIKLLSHEAAARTEIPAHISGNVLGIPGSFNLVASLSSHRDSCKCPLRTFPHKRTSECPHG